MFHTHSRNRNRLVVLPPPGSKIPTAFRNVQFDDRRHCTLLAAMQRMRGSVYLEDGAIGPEHLTADRRHHLPDDSSAWHMLSVTENGDVTACLRYLDERHSAGFHGLWVSRTALAHCPRQGWKLRMAVTSKFEGARAARLGFGSVGGWASVPDRRRTLEPVGIILATYGLLELLGGCLGVATATFRHQSAAILRKIGLSPITWSGDRLPPYYEPKYQCQMEVLEFDSRRPNPKYRADVEDYVTELSAAAVICRPRTREPWQDLIPPNAPLRAMAAVA